MQPPIREKFSLIATARTNRFQSAAFRVFFPPMLATVLSSTPDDGRSAVSGGSGSAVQSEARRHPSFGKQTPRHIMSRMQKDFARFFVENGGNAQAAARSAGYDDWDTMAVKNMAHGSVLAEIKRLSAMRLEQHSGQVIERLVKIVLNDKTPPQLAADLGIKLLDRAGSKPKSSPLVEIRQDNRSVSIGSSEAQQLIGQIWQGRKPQLSDISGGMSDTDDADAEALIELEGEAPPGGDHSQGPAAAPDPIPPHADENG